MACLGWDDAVVLSYHFGPEEGRALWHAGRLLTFKASAADTAGRFWLMELLASSGSVAPLHSHAHEDLAAYVLDGALTCVVGEHTFRASPGTFVYVPRSVVHTFTVETPSARLLVLGTPAGAENFFWETGEPARALTLPPGGWLIDKGVKHVYRHG
jgi:quercetin dioxygenase-like cupin family protein